MTTPAAARLYLAQHEVEHEGKAYAFFNPHEKQFGQLPLIIGFNNGGREGWCEAALVAEDGTGLGGHICSSEGYMRHDLGILEGTREDRHETFRKHYPDGYRMTFVGCDEVKAKTHEALKKAIELNQAMAAKEDVAE